MGLQAPYGTDEHRIDGTLNLRDYLDGFGRHGIEGDAPFDSVHPSTRSVQVEPARQGRPPRSQEQNPLVKTI